MKTQLRKGVWENESSHFLNPKYECGEGDAGSITKRREENGRRAKVRLFF